MQQRLCLPYRFSLDRDEILRSVCALALTLHQAVPVKRYGSY
ncbi:hypothetical protein [uncultured Bilophila sp.]|nr:hypothetical protein [uncultured Bilophila sp.]